MIVFATASGKADKEKKHLANKENLQNTTGLVLKIDRIGTEVVLCKPEIPIF